jgi:hypothetical protein
LRDKCALPGRQDNRPLVLLARSVLGEEARPALRVRLELEPRPVVDAIETAARQYRQNGVPALLNDARVAGVEGDPELEDLPPVRGEAAISEIHPKQVDLYGRETPDVMPSAASRTAATAPRQHAPGHSSVHPVANGPARHADKAGHLGGGAAFGGELKASSDYSDGMGHANTCSHHLRTALSAAERIRTSTGRSPPPPEDGASTRFRHSRVTGQM